MQINNTNLNAMTKLESSLNNIAKDVATVTDVRADEANQAVTPDLIKSITEQIPTVISYEANASAIKTQNAVHDALLDIKA